MPAWPDAPQPAKAEIGHNKPPVEDDVRAQFKEALLADRPNFLARVEEIEGAAARVKVTDDESLGRAGEFINTIRAHYKHVETVHKDVKAPYLAAGRVADAEKNALADRLADARDTTQRKMDSYATDIGGRKAKASRRLPPWPWP